MKLTALFYNSNIREIEERFMFCGGGMGCGCRVKNCWNASMYLI